MKKTVKLRNIVIGEGMPKICVPIVGASREEILDEARAVIELPADIVEWRIDHYEDVFDRGRFAETLGELRAVLGDMPLLVTFRSLAEGGFGSGMPGGSGGNFGGSMPGSAGGGNFGGRQNGNGGGR